MKRLIKHRLREDQQVKLNLQAVTSEFRAEIEVVTSLSNLRRTIRKLQRQLNEQRKRKPTPFRQVV
jgi:PleD family two-component response regulator